MILTQAKIAFIKWSTNLVKDEDSWTEQELQRAAESVDWESSHWRHFEAGYQAGVRDQALGVRR